MKYATLNLESINGKLEPTYLLLSDGIKDFHLDEKEIKKLKEVLAGNAKKIFLSKETVGQNPKSAVLFDELA